jgi:hypothetical protein
MMMLQIFYPGACIALSSPDGLGSDVPGKRSVVLVPKQAQMFSQVEVEKRAEAT